MSPPPDVDSFHGRCFVPLPTGEESARLDREAIEGAGIPSPVLMENAGRSAALVLDRLWPAGPVVVGVGPGNNGGDGLVLARTLATQGRRVRILTPTGRAPDDPLLHGWRVPVLSVVDPDEVLVEALAGASVLVDALLGTGATGPPREPGASLIRAMNQSGTPILALDLPSGVDARSGAVPGEAIRAAVTVAFGAPKLGSLRHPGRERTGRLVAVEIGFPPSDGEEASAALITPGWADAHRPRRPPVTHKKAQGWVVVLAGSSGMAGAAVLAARGALRAGAGYVQVASDPSNRAVLQRSAPEAIFLDATDAAVLREAVRSCDALVAGPGWGTDEDAAERLDALLSLPDLPGVVLDADGLTLLGRGALPGWRGVPAPDRRLLTPHPGEMARLGWSPEVIRDDPLGCCREGAERWGAALLLKGNPSVVGAPGPGPVLVSGTGSPHLARAGMGDVLAGVAGALLARGCSAREAGALALHYTGRAALLAGRGEALLPWDVAEGLGDALLEAVPDRSKLGFPFVTVDLAPPP